MPLDGVTLIGVSLPITLHIVPLCLNHNCSSGFEGPWTFAPTTVTNDFYKLLFEETYVSGLVTIFLAV